MLEAAGIARARAIVAATGSEAINVFIAYRERVTRLAELVARPR